jgi:hypothetical protein
MFNAALCYADGIGTARDPHGCFAWMRRAAEAGCVDAMYLTALAYQEGRGTEMAEQEFEAWIARAAAAGHRQALIAGRLAQLKAQAIIDAARHGALVTAFQRLLAAVCAIKNDHIVESAAGGVVHHAPWSTLDKLLPCRNGASMANHVRLYNAAYCTDAWEGRRLIELDDDDAALLGAFLDNGPSAGSGGPETDYGVYLARFSLSCNGPAVVRGHGEAEEILRIVAPLSAFDQRRASASPPDAVRRPILPAALHDPLRSEATLYRVKYDDAEARETLARLRDPLAAIGVVSDRVSEPDGVCELVRIVVGEVLHLYQYQERREEREARLLAHLPISSPLIESDDSQPGRLYVRSPDLLFTASGTRILVPSSCRDATASMLNLKYRLARQGLLGTTSVGLDG